LVCVAENGRAAGPRRLCDRRYNPGRPNTRNTPTQARDTGTRRRVTLREDVPVAVEFRDGGPGV